MKQKQLLVRLEDGTELDLRATDDNWVAVIREIEKRFGSRAVKFWLKPMSEEKIKEEELAMELALN